MSLRQDARKIAYSFLTFGALGLTLLISAPVWAQVSGATVTGTARDASGAVVPNTQISIKNVGTRIDTSVVTNADGFYSAPNLLPGTYSISASATGFTTVTRMPINLSVGEQRVLNFDLAVGMTTQNVEVTGETSPVELGSSMIGAVVNSTAVRELPLNGRDWTTLATLQPGVSGIRTQASVNAASNRGNRGFGNEMTINGRRPTDNNYRMNGISINDFSNGAPGSTLGVNLGVDAIEEFSVLTTNYTAEYGRTSGGVINAITKSGTSAFHGGAYWFLRDEDFDARNFFDPPKIPPFHRNNFGVSVGGPIKKDKAFFFVDYEGIRQSQSLTFRDTVPSQDARNGILHNADGTTTTITVDSKVAPYLPLWPLPNSGLIAPGNTGFLTTTGLLTASENYAATRVDWKFSDKDSLAGSYLFDDTPLNIPDSLVSVLNQTTARRQVFTLEATHIFSSTFVSTSRVGVNRFFSVFNNSVTALNPLANDPSLGSIPGRFAPVLNVPGLTTMSGSFGATSPAGHGYTSVQAYEDAFLVKGTHALKFGFAFERMLENIYARPTLNGSFSFPSLLGFLTNTPTSVSVLNPAFSRVVGIRQSLFGGYLHDDWRWRPNLTLNLGVRYEMTTIPTEANNLFTPIQNLAGGLPVPSDHAWQTNATIRNFEPRVGFAWDPLKNGKTAIRGGFAIFDVLPLPYQIAAKTAPAYPFAVQSSASLTGLPPGSVFPDGLVPLIVFDPNNLTNVRSVYYEPHPRRSYTLNWNLNVQQSLGWNTSVMVGYIGSRGLHQPFTTGDSNGVPGQLTSAGFLWPFPVGSGSKLNPNVGQFQGQTWDGDSSYHGLQAQVSKRIGHGIQAQLAYTWGRCIDSGSGASFSDFFTNSVAGILPYANRYGNCDFDIRHVLVGNYIWYLPKPRFGGKAVERILGGWQLGGIVSANTGAPFTPLIGGDPLGQKNTARGPYPDRLHIAGCESVTNPGNVDNYLKLNCFSPPVAPASFAAVCQPADASVAAVIPNTCMNLMGNAGRNQVFGPGLFNVDTSLFKNIPIRKISESFNAQLRFEFFNILNHVNFQAPIANSILFNQNGTSVAGAGAINATSTESRRVQFGLKIMW